MLSENNRQDQEERPVPDPRDYLSNERTYLAWVRTSIGIMVFGFVVVKFTLFVKELSIMLQKPLPNHDYVSVLGISLVALGVLVVLISFLQYKKIGSQLGNSNFQPSASLSTILTISILLIGILLVTYLVVGIS
ncbi:MAG: DUF202 domain-containing protein [Bacteroidia bacterium]